MAQAFGVGLIRYLIDTNVASEMRKPNRTLAQLLGCKAWT
jgi:predicted nucleic acid-binding protein